MTDSPQDFNKPITIVLTGSGTATMAHIDATFMNLILSGLPEDGDRYVRVLVPFDDTTSGVGVTRAVQWFTDTLPAEELTGVVWSPSKLVSKMKVTIKAEEGITTPLSALEFALNAAAGYQNSSEVFFFSFYDSENETDLEQIRVAKNYRGIRTANVCLAGTDVWENYESTDEILIREKAEAEFAAQVAEETAKAPAKKAVAKKAVAPHKKAAAKVLVAEDVPLLPEPQAAVQSPSEALPDREETGLDRLIARRVAEEAAGKMRESLVVFKPTEDIFTDVDKAARQVVSSDTIAVKKEDLLRLLDVLTDIVKGMP